MPTFQNLDRRHYPPRPANARPAVEKILRALAADYGAEKIIAFGSAVRGGVTEHSDIDLCVIREHPPGCTHPGVEADLVVARRSPTVSTDILERSPAQFAEARPLSDLAELVPAPFCNFALAMIAWIPALPRWMERNTPSIS